jgi:hypothetical protein
MAGGEIMAKYRKSGNINGAQAAKANAAKMTAINGRE